MKRLMLVTVVVLTCLFLTACGSNEQLKGKYYSLETGKKILQFEFNDTNGKYYESGKTYIVDDIDTKKKQFNIVGGITLPATYELSEDGKMTLFVSGDSSEEILYKEGSIALEKALKEENKE